MNKNVSSSNVHSLSGKRSSFSLPEHEELAVENLRTKCITFGRPSTGPLAENIARDNAPSYLNNSKHALRPYKCVKGKTRNNDTQSIQSHSAYDPLYKKLGKKKANTIFSTTDALERGK